MVERRDDSVVCRSNQGIDRISPGVVIYEGRGWQVEHAFPCSLLGWLVIVLRRHAVALHELTPEEAAELGEIQAAVAGALHCVLDSAKEDVHLVPRAPDLPRDERGGHVFAHLEPSDDVLPADAVVRFCAAFAPQVASEMATFQAMRVHGR